MYLNYCNAGKLGTPGDVYLSALYPTKSTSSEFVDATLSGCNGKISQQKLTLTDAQNESMKVSKSDFDKPEKNESSNFKIKVTSCGGVDNIPVSVPRITRNLYNVLKYLVPVALILLGMFDFFRSFIASDEKLMRDGIGRFIKRIIAGVLVFLVLAIAQLVFGLISDSSTTDNISDCISCFLGDESDCGPVQIMVD